MAKGFLSTAAHILGGWDAQLAVRRCHEPLAICGPRGGMRAVEAISIDEIEKMATQLQAAVADARAGAAIDPVDCFIQDVIDRLGDPALALDPSFRSWCAGNHGLLSPRQAAERWCCWHVA